MTTKSARKKVVKKRKRVTMATRIAKAIHDDVQASLREIIRDYKNWESANETTYAFMDATRRQLEDHNRAIAALAAMTKRGSLRDES